VKLSANAEAISHLTTALRLLETVPDNTERAQQELTAQVALGAPLMATKGYAARELERAYLRARDLCRQLGDTTQLFSVLYGLRFYYAMRTEHRMARQLADELLTIAQTTHDPALLVEAHAAQSNTLIWFGEFVATRAHLERALALYDRQQHSSHAFHYG